MSLELRPGIKALTLPHHEMSSLHFGRVVIVQSAPQRRNIYNKTNRLYTDVVCFIKYEDMTGLLDKPPGCVGWGWPASALLPLPPDEDAKKMFEREQKVWHKGRWRSPSKIVAEELISHGT